MGKGAVPVENVPVPVRETEDGNAVPGMDVTLVYGAVPLEMGGMEPDGIPEEKGAVPLDKGVAGLLTAPVENGAVPVVGVAEGGAVPVREVAFVKSGVPVEAVPALLGPVESGTMLEKGAVPEEAVAGLLGPVDSGAPVERGAVPGTDVVFVKSAVPDESTAGLLGPVESGLILERGAVPLPETVEGEPGPERVVPFENVPVPDDGCTVPLPADPVERGTDPVIGAVPDGFALEPPLTDPVAGGTPLERVPLENTAGPVVDAPVPDGGAVPDEPVAGGTALERVPLVKTGGPVEDGPVPEMGAVPDGPMVLRLEMSPVPVGRPLLGTEAVPGSVLAGREELPNGPEVGRPLLRPPLDTGGAVPDGKEAVAEGTDTGAVPVLGTTEEIGLTGETGAVPDEMGAVPGKLVVELLKKPPDAELVGALFVPIAVDGRDARGMVVPVKGAVPNIWSAVDKLEVLLPVVPELCPAMLVAGAVPVGALEFPNSALLDGGGMAEPLALDTGKLPETAGLELDGKGPREGMAPVDRAAELLLHIVSK